MTRAGPSPDTEDASAFLWDSQLQTEEEASVFQMPGLWTFVTAAGADQDNVLCVLPAPDQPATTTQGSRGPSSPQREVLPPGSEQRPPR